MADDKPTTEAEAQEKAQEKPQAKAKPQPTPGKAIPAELLKKVKRTVVEKNKGGKPTEKKVAIKADEVLAWKERDGQVTVVTTDGRKFRSEEE